MQNKLEVKKPLKSALRRTLEHCVRWLKSGRITITHHNPKFNKDSPRKIAIYCVHGFADRVGSFEYFVSRIINQLPDSIDSVKVLAFTNRWKGQCTIELANQLKNNLVLNEDKDVILVGHSQGGLVISYFATYLAQALGINVHLVVPICAPFQGSHLALPPLTYFSKSIAQMQPETPFLIELSEKVISSSLNFAYIGASRDKLVSAEAYLPYHFVSAFNNHLLVEGETHISIMSSPTLIEFFMLHVKAASKRLSSFPAQPRL
jgi:pimeloyl-ACP methyl ester carboxylesterase